MLTQKGIVVGVIENARVIFANGAPQPTTKLLQRVRTAKHPAEIP
jgi:hypothetical protein